MGLKRKRIAVYIIMVLTLCARNNASAECLDNNINSVVQVVLTYTTQQGNTFRLQSGSGIVINNNTVLTNYHVIHMSENNLKKARKYIARKGDKAEITNGDSIQVSIVKQDDVLISASVSLESKENDFAILTLAEPTDRPPVVMSNSSEMIIAQGVTAVGYPKTDPFSDEGMTFFAQSDVNLIQGTVSEIGTNANRISGNISSGNSGGALLDQSTGELIGLLVYTKKSAEKECFMAIPIDFIKHPYLEGVAYTENLMEASTEAETTEEVTATVNKDLLEREIQKAASLDKSAYTIDTYNYMMTWWTQAEEVLRDESATQKDVDRARENLQRGIGNLEVNKQTNWGLIVCIIVAVTAVIAVMAVLIIVLMNSRKKKKQERQFQVLPPYDIPANPGGKPDDRDGDTPSSPYYDSINTGDGTTLLNNAGMEDYKKETNATTVLTGSPMPQVKAYLTRKKNGESRCIDCNEFTIGKDASKVNYCIRDNAAISRCHMKVVKRGTGYYIIDLASTNHTYLNEVCLEPQEEHKLKSGDIIVAADEEFLFEIK